MSLSMFEVICLCSLIIQLQTQLWDYCNQIKVRAEQVVLECFKKLHVGNCTGNPWVFFGLPAPVPIYTHTRNPWVTSNGSCGLVRVEWTHQSSIIFNNIAKTD